jgi:hypothetical protein
LEQKRVRSTVPTKSCSSDEGNEGSSSLAFLGNNLHSGADKSNKSNNADDQAKKLSEKSKSTINNVVSNILPGTTSPTQKQAWGRFWQKIIVEVTKKTGG